MPKRIKESDIYRFHGIDYEDDECNGLLIAEFGVCMWEGYDGDLSYAGIIPTFSLEAGGLSGRREHLVGIGLEPDETDKALAALATFQY